MTGKWLIGGVIILAGMGCGYRIWEWRRWYSQSLREAPIRLSLRLSKPVERNEFGCKLEAKGIRIWIPQAKCENSRLNDAAAGDGVHLEVKLETTGQVTATKVEWEPAKLRPLISPSWWQRQISQVRRRAILVYQRTLTEPEASLMAGIVLGEKATLPETFGQALVKTGTMHVVAASGYNVSVVAAIAVQVLVRWWSRKWAALWAMVWVWIYVVLAGADPPVVRAGLMGSVMLGGWMTGRDYWSSWGLVMSVLIMILVSPWLVGSVSFQLSVAATIGVIYVARGVGGWLDRWVKMSQRYWWLKTIVDNGLTTVAAVVMTAPISLMVFGQVSGLGLIVNPVVLSVIPVLMYLGLVEALVGLIWLPLAGPISWLILPVAHSWAAVILLTAKLPGGMIQGSMTWSMAIGWWLVIIGVSTLGLKRISTR